MKLRSVVLPVLFLLVFISLWEVLPPWLGVPKYIVPKFSEVMAIYADPAALRLYFDNALYTLSEAGFGFLIGAGLGFVVAVILTSSPVLMTLFYPYIIALQCMPKVAIAPLLVVWFGFGMTSKVIVVALLCFFPVLVNTISGIRGVSREQTELFQVIRASRMQTLIHLAIPAALPSVLTGIELAVVVSLLGAIVGEFVGAEHGLGVLLLQAQFQMSTPSVFAILGVLALLGVVFNIAVRSIRKRTLFWIVGETGK